MTSQLPERHKRIARYLLELLPSSFDRKQERVRRLDTIIVWLVGLSVASIGFIISQSGTNLELSAPVQRWGVGLFVATILAGLFGRIATLFLQRHMSEARDRFFGHLYAVLDDSEALPDAQEISVGRMRELLQAAYGPTEQPAIQQASDAGIVGWYEAFRDVYTFGERTAAKRIFEEMFAAQGGDPSQAEGMLGGGGDEASRNWTLAVLVFTANLLFHMSALSFMGGVVVVSVAFIGG